MNTSAKSKSLSVNVRLSGSLKEYLERTTSEGDYESTSEYVRDLIRRDKAAKEEAAFRSVKAQLQAAFAVPESEAVTVSGDDIRKLAQSRLKK